MQNTQKFLIEIWTYMKRILAVIFLMATSKLCYSDTKHPIDVDLDKCLAKDTNYSTAAMKNCIVAAGDSWDKELNINYQALMKKLDKNGQENLKTAQIAWLKYRDFEFKSIDSIYEKTPGTMYIPIKAEKILAITKDRALKLNSYLLDLN